MPWNRRYWDIIEQIYWTPRYAGLRSIGQKDWIKENDRISVPVAMVNSTGPLYTRALKNDAFIKALHGSEEVLNHLFDITFAIAPDALLTQCFLTPLGFSDPGPIEALKREICSRYGWGWSENVTQPDALFVSARSAIGVEIKLNAVSSPDQILKYAAVLAWEEMAAGPREQLGLLYVIPEGSLARHWLRCGLDGPKIDRSFLTRRWQKPPTGRVHQLLTENPELLGSVLDRMRVAVITWTQLKDQLESTIATLDQKQRGDQTLYRLLDGFLGQLHAHRGTGITSLDTSDLARSPAGD